MSEQQSPPPIQALLAGMDPAAQANYMVQAALSSSAPRIHANGLGLALTGSDILMTLWSNGTPSAVINISFPFARSLVIDLGLVLQDIESAIDRKIPTPKEIQEGVARLQHEKAASASALGE